MTSENEATVSKVINEVWSNGHLEMVHELVAQDYVGHSPTAGLETRGTDGYRQFFGALRTAFPDIRFTIDDCISSREKVVVRWTARGTHLGEFAGIQKTGSPAVVTGTSTFRLQDGRVRECWTNADDLGLLRQIGAVPTPS